VCGSLRFALDLGNGVKTGTFQLHLHLREKEAIACCGWRVTHVRGVLGDRVNCRRGESNSSSATDPVAFAECSPSNAAVKLCVEGPALGDEFAMNNPTDVEKHDEHGLR
jgi:hypothetical protein